MSAKHKALKKRAGGSLLRFALGKTEKEMHDSGSHAAIYDKSGKVKKNINQ